MELEYDYRKKLKPDIKRWKSGNIWNVILFLDTASYLETYLVIPVNLKLWSKSESCISVPKSFPQSLEKKKSL